jgi:hypothetical protein
MRLTFVVTVLLAILVGSAVVIVGRSSLFAVPEQSTQATIDHPLGSSATAVDKTASARTAETLELMRTFSQSAAQLDLGGKDPTAKPSALVSVPRGTGGSPPPAGPAASSNRAPIAGDNNPNLTATLLPDATAETSSPSSGGRNAAGPPTSPATTPIARYAAAAAGGDLNAAYRLGLAYRDGSGVPPDSATAVHWLLAAATGGHAQAEIAVAEMYAHGTGVTRDPGAAYKWFDRAATGAAAAFARDYAAKERDRVAATMSEAELEKARRMVGD